MGKDYNSKGPIPRPPKRGSLLGRVDEKGRVYNPQNLRARLGLKPGNKIIFSVVNSTLLVRKAISANEFKQIVEEISEELRTQTDFPITFEKLF